MQFIIFLNKLILQVLHSSVSQFLYLKVYFWNLPVCCHHHHYYYLIIFYVICFRFSRNNMYFGDSAREIFRFVTVTMGDKLFKRSLLRSQI